MARRTGLLATLLLLLATVGAGVLAVPAQAEPHRKPVGATVDQVRARAASPDAWTGTKSVARQVVTADGTRKNFPFADPFKITVNADHTENLRGRERVEISWSGAQPSAARASNPYGVAGTNQEYPVVILQCRGTTTTVSPETCWTSTFTQRSQVSRSAADAVWTHDVDGDADDRQDIGGMTPFPSASTCPNVDRSGLLKTHVTPFVSAKGKKYAACDSNQMPPEAAADSAFPAAEIAAYSDENGAGSTQFEVRSDVENESLGCNDKTACSIVVIPIMGVSCDQASTAVANDLPAVEKNCRRTGRFAPGSSNFANLGVDDAVSPLLWWSASNWKNRFVIPITFGLPPDTCDILDQRPPTGFYGSELLAQAAIQWTPAYCLSKKRFKFQFNNMPDEAGFNLMKGGDGAAAVVSSEHPAGADPVGYAPTAVTGFAIGYVIDKPDNQGEYTTLRMNPRLVAKLLTQSYLGSGVGKDHPGMAGNPWAIMSDPEFIRLNPGLSHTAQEAGAALLSLSNSSDIVQQLTDWISRDKAAMDFIAGRPDPWGMKVNPSYRKIALPTDEWPLLDSYVPTSGSECMQQNPMNYFSLLAAPVTTLQKIAVALLDSWPNVQTRCDTDASVTPHLYKLGRIDRQSYGSRFMMGIVSLGDAARYGLRTAALATGSDRYVAPTTASLEAGVRLTKQQKKYAPFALDQGAVKHHPGAYPGTMVVYTAARLRNLKQADADKVAQFIRLSTTEGQRVGSGNGELPDGFVPIRRTGVTAALYRSAQQVADAVEKQTPAPSPPASPSASASAGPDAPTAPPAPPGAAPSGATPPASAAPSSSPSSAPQAVAMPATKAVGSDLAGGVLPVLILLGAIGCVATAAFRVGAPYLRGRR